jgi:hypothetical protein
LQSSVEGSRGGCGQQNRCRFFGRGNSPPACCNIVFLDNCNTRRLRGDSRHPCRFNSCLVEESASIVRFALVGICHVAVLLAPTKFSVRAAPRSTSVLPSGIAQRVSTALCRDLRQGDRGSRETHVARRCVRLPAVEGLSEHVHVPARPRTAQRFARLPSLRNRCAGNGSAARGMLPATRQTWPERRTATPGLVNCSRAGARSPR